MVLESQPEAEEWMSLLAKLSAQGTVRRYSKEAHPPQAASTDFPANAPQPQTCATSYPLSGLEIATWVRAVVVQNMGALQRVIVGQIVHPALSCRGCGGGPGRAEAARHRSSSRSPAMAVTAKACGTCRSPGSPPSARPGDDTARTCSVCRGWYGKATVSPSLLIMNSPTLTISAGHGWSWHLVLLENDGKFCILFSLRGCFQCSH